MSVNCFHLTIILWIVLICLTNLFLILFTRLILTSITSFSKWKIQIVALNTNPITLSTLLTLSLTNKSILPLYFYIISSHQFLLYFFLLYFFFYIKLLFYYKIFYVINDFYCVFSIKLFYLFYSFFYLSKIPKDSSILLFFNKKNKYKRKNEVQRNLKKYLSAINTSSINLAA